jgi:hypothetical protein
VKQVYLFGIVISFFFTACRPVSPLALTQNTQIHTSATPLQETAPRRTATTIPFTQSASLIPKLEYQYVTICPDSPTVSWLELMVDPHMELLVQPANEGWRVETGVYLLLPNNDRLVLVENSVPPTGWIYGGYHTVLGGTKLISFRYQEEIIIKEIWISSVNGEVETQVGLIEADEWAYVHEIGKLIVTGSPIERYGDWRDEMPIYMVDLATQERVYLDPLPRDMVFHDIFTFDNEIFSLAFDWGNYNDINLFSYEEGNLIPILSWIEKRVGRDSLPTKFGMIDQGMYVFVERSYGLDYMQPQGFSDLQEDRSYEDMMISIHFPIEAESIPGRTMIINLGETDSFLLLEDLVAEESFLYRLDIKHRILFDYCLDNPPDMSHYSPSPDGNYLAVTTYTREGWNTQTAEGSYVLDLITGAKAYLEGIKVIGWVIEK